MMTTTMANSVRMTLKTLKEANSSDAKVQALTSFRRLHLDDRKVIKSLNDEDFCELCNSIIKVSITESISDKLHIEACRTLDIILPETKNKNYDFFLSILQINRKKRLKILVSLSILKDETVAIIASKLSILSFLSNCLEKIQPNVMTWLLPENADNIQMMKIIDNKALNENEDFEERVVEGTLELLSRMYTLSSCGLSIKQFDTFVMDKVLLLAYMGHRRQRSSALAVLQQAAKSDLGTRVKSFHKNIWDKFKQSLQTIFCKRMMLLVNECSMEWAQQWETSILLIGSDLHKGSALVNSLLKVEEHAFKCGDVNRRQAFLTWKSLIDNFALDPRELATMRRVKLLCVPLNAKNSKTEVMVLTKMEVWWHLIYKIYPSLAEFTDMVLIQFLTLCFGPFGDKPLFVQVNDSSVALGKKFYKTQIYSIGALVQLIVSKDNLSKVSIGIINEKLPSPVNNAVFEKIYKIFIHCFGESIITLALLSDDSIKNKSDICKIMWNSLITRIEGYDKMKVSMYKEILSVLSELIKNQFHKISLIKDFLLNVVLKNFDNIASSVQFTQNILIELVNTFIHVENFSQFKKDHYEPLELLLRHLVKPTNSNIYYSETLELMQKIIKTISEARKNNGNIVSSCEIWCIVAKIAKQYIEDSQNFNEGNLLEYNFKTIEDIIAFPFKNLITDDLLMIAKIAEAWCNLYKHFQFQAELIVTVQPNEIVEQTSKMFISSLENNSMSCDIIAVCIDALLDVINYNNLPSEKEIPQFVHLLKNITLQSMHTESFATDKVLKVLSSFLLRVFNHSTEKTAFYLKTIEPAVELMLTKVDNSSFGDEVLKTWTTIVSQFKRLQKFLSYELLSCYQQAIITAASNPITSSVTYSLFDVNGNIDERSRQLLEDLVKGLEETSNFKIDDMKEKLKKKTTPVSSFLNRKSISPSTRTPGKENVKLAKSPVVPVEPNSQDFVVINSEVRLDVNRLTDHQKEKLKKRKEDIPAMYNELSISNSQDSQQLQHWFDTKIKPPTSSQKKEVTNNNNETSKIASPSTFKNITQILNDQEKTAEMLPSASTSTSSSSSAVTGKDEESAATMTVRESPRIKGSINNNNNNNNNNNRREVEAPIVAKKLEFDDEYEEEEKEVSDKRQREDTSSSIIEGVKMRRKNTNVEEGSSPAAVQEKVHHLRRSSLHERESLKKSNSSNQLPTQRGRKRRNSESNSAGVLNIERVKKSRITESLEVCNSLDSIKSNESKIDTEVKKGPSKRTMIEISRLKIDMVFQPLPNRRSIGKTSENSNEDKKADKQNKIASPTKSKDNKVITSPSKVDNNHPQNRLKVKTRSSLKGFEPLSLESSLSKSDANKQKETMTNKKDKKSDNTEVHHSRTTRNSLPGKVESNAFKKKNEILIVQEESIIENASVQAEDAKKSELSNTVKPTVSEKSETSMTEIKATQDPDIVESSQEPSFNTKYNNTECVIKIKKVELVQKPIAVEQVAEKTVQKEIGLKVIDETPVDLEDKSVSVIPVTVDIEKVPAVQTEAKKIENTSTKSTTAGNHISSPRSSTSRFKKNYGVIGGRAAWMVDLVTKQSLGDKVGGTESIKPDFNLTDEVTIVPLKKDKLIIKETTGVSSSIGSRQSKIFNNMNNLKTPERSSSPSMSMFSNLKNDGERISPKLEKHLQEKESEANNIEKEFSQNETSDSSDDSPKKRDLPILEWSSANPPSLTASPSGSILKRMQELQEVDTPGSKKKRVSFADPPVSREMGYEIMTDTSSPPRLEKLPTTRSPVSLIGRRKRISRTDQNSTFPFSPKIRLLSKIENQEVKASSSELQTSNTQDDMFEDATAPATTTENSTMVKTSTQTDQNNSSIKLDSINISNISEKSNSNLSSNSLDDTVDINNLSTSLNSTHHSIVKITSSQSKDQTDTLPVTDSVFSNAGLSQESQNNVAQLNKPETLDSTQPVYPSLTSCNDAIDFISAELVDPMFVDDLAKHFTMMSIRSIGDLAQLTEREVNRLPIIAPKIDNVKKVLSRYEERLKIRTPEKKMNSPSCVLSSTPLEKKRSDKIKSLNDSFEDLAKSSSSNLESIIDKKMVLKSPLKRTSIDNSMQTSPIKRQKKDDEKLCIELMDQCDDDFLLKQFVKRFDFEKALQVFNVSSLELLSILAKNVAQQKKTDINYVIPETTDLQVVLDNVSSDSIIKQVKSRDELKSSETLFKIVFKNSTDKLSDDIRRTVLKTITEKYTSCELVDVCHDLMKSKLTKVQKK